MANGKTKLKEISMTEVRKLNPEIQERLKKEFRCYLIPALIEVLGIIYDQLEQRGVIIEIFHDGEPLPL